MRENECTLGQKHTLIIQEDIISWLIQVSPFFKCSPSAVLHVKIPLSAEKSPLVGG